MTRKKHLNLESIESARAKLAAAAAHWRLEEVSVPLEDALGRVLARDIHAASDIPGFRRAIVDGYALFSADTSRAGEERPVNLRLAGEVEAGRPAALSLQRGECAYVPTGAMLPEGADAMVMVEHTSAEGAAVRVFRPAAPNDGLAEADEDARAGSLLLARGARLRPCDIGALAADGHTTAPVWAPLTLVLISTGSELVAPKEAPGPGQVRDINSASLAALAKESGLRVGALVRLGEDAAALENAVRSSCAHLRGGLVVVSGGSSMGERDETAAVFERVCGRPNLVQGLCLKPGKPTIIASSAATDTLLFGLPGHPVSAIVTFKLFVRWLYRRLSGQADPPPVPARLSRPVTRTDQRVTLQSVKLRFDPTESRLYADPIPGKSGMITTLTRSDAHIVLPLDTPHLPAGTDILAYPD